MVRYFKPLINIFFPDLCISCSQHEPVHEKLFCDYCWHDLPRYEDLDNSIEFLKHKFPLIPVETVHFYGLFLYSKGTKVQNMLHDIKYYGKSYKANDLGQLLGRKINNEEYDALIPVPIHTKKKRKRGYNQAEVIARGISETSGIKVINNALLKVADTGSQTHLDRASRLLNVARAYSKGKPLSPQIRKVLIVDDVITTGATLEVCSDLLKQGHSVEVDYAFIAMAV